MSHPHPIMLNGPDIIDWRNYLSCIIEEMFNPLHKIKLINDIIKLGPGKYIITFTSANNCIHSLWKHLYCSNARFIITYDIIFEVSIADTTKQYSVNTNNFVINAPYEIYPIYLPCILYKGYYGGNYTNEYSEYQLIQLKQEVDNENRIKELEKNIDNSIDIYSWQYDLITEYFDAFK